MTLIDDNQLEDLVTAVLTAVRREYPHRLDQELHADGDLRPPRQLNPSFYGNYDWHSAVHSHWFLVRALGRGLLVDTTTTIVALLDEHLIERRLSAETAFFAGPGGTTSERPYGWAWLLLLHAECQAVDDTHHRRWARALDPLASMLGDRLTGYFADTLAFPIRTGTHGNTAFSLHMSLQAARRRGDGAAEKSLVDAARSFFGDDGPLPWSEPASGDAFLSAPLVEVALMADVLPAEELAAWIDRVLPEPSALPLAPPRFRPDGTDPGTVHLEGLLMSRGWCLQALGEALPPSHPVSAPALKAAADHTALATQLDPTDGFNRSHWMPTFLLYLDERQAAD
jgi:hypothetical protein